MAQSVQEKLEDLSDVAAHVGEVILLGYGESSSTGPYLRLLLPDPDDLAPFRGKNTHRKGKQGTRYLLLMVELQDDETPAAEPPKAESYSPEAMAYSICRIPMFRQYAKWRAEREGLYIEATEKGAGDFIKHYCDVPSRKHLSHSPVARSLFADLMLAYKEWGGSDA